MTRIIVMALLLTVTVPALAQQPPVPVVVTQAREKAVERNLTIAGRVFSRNDANLSTTLAGQLEWVAEPGTLVKQGDVIARMDEQPIQLRRQELENQAAREQVNQRYLGKEVTRLRALRETNSASERLLDEAEANRDRSTQDLAIIRTRIGQLDDELRRSRVTAGFDGVVAERFLRGGEYVRPGDPILRLVDVDTLEVRFQVPVAYVGRLHIADKVVLETRHAGQYDGRVRTLIPAVNENSQTFEARVDLALPGNVPIVAGQLVSVKVALSGGSSVMIPRDAVVLRAEGNFVFRIGSDNVAERVAVELGEGERDWVSVSGPLREGDWVAIRGVERLQQGQSVVRSGG